VSQFRQEKDHELQIKSFALFLKSDFISQRRYSSSVVADLLPNSNIGRRGGGVDFSLPLSTSFDGRPKLILIGSCRNSDDESRVEKLKAFAASLGVSDSVEFLVNVDNAVLSRLLSEALVVIHTMWNEHFGISCVEAQAAGAVLLAHNSGGPKQDIARQINGLIHIFVVTLFFLI
jgi:glycosyltransferase involved in cell wall biosynthesis